MNGTESSLQSSRDYLRNLFLDRKKLNPRLSLRAFAKTLGLQPSFLSMVFSGQRQISEATAHDIVEKLRLKDRDGKRLKLLVRFEKASTPLQKSEALDQLRKVDPRLEGKRDLAVEHFRIISDWYHLPLRLLIDLAGFEWSEERAAQALGIPVQEVRAALERMAALSLIEWKPGQKPTRARGRVEIISPFKNQALLKYHRQMLQKIHVAMETQDAETRYTRTQNLCLSGAQLREVREELAACEERIAAIAERTAKKKSLYHLNLNLIHLLKPSKEKS